MIQTKGYSVERKRFILDEASLLQQSAKKCITNQKDASVLSTCVGKVIPGKEAKTYESLSILSSFTIDGISGRLGHA